MNEQGKLHEVQVSEDAALHKCQQPCLNLLGYCSECVGEPD